jgi:hypothetical protein
MFCFKMRKSLTWNLIPSIVSLRFFNSIVSAFEMLQFLIESMQL